MIDANASTSNIGEDDDIDLYSVTKWRTPFSIFRENTSLLMQKDSFRSLMGYEYISNLAERWRELQRTQYRHAFILFFLIMFIGTIGSSVAESIVIFGIRLSNQNAALAILLLLSSILMLFNSFIGLISSQYEALIKSLINSLMDEKTSEYYIQQFSWTVNSLFGEYDIQHRHWLASGVIIFAAVMFVTSSLLALLILAGLQLYIFASSILFIYENPRLPLHLNIPIVLVAICAFLFFIAELLLRLPLPYSDKSTMDKLESLEKTDPERANRIWNNIATHSLKRERRNVIVLQITVVISTIVACELMAGARAFLVDYSQLTPIALSAVMFGLVFSPALDKYESRMILKATKVENKELRVYMYNDNKKKILLLRLIVAFLFGIGMFFWIQ